MDETISNKMTDITPKQSHDIRDETITLLYDAIPLSVVASIINAAIITTILWDVLPGNIPFFWFLSMLLVLGYRLILAMFYKQRNLEVSHHNWGLHFNVLAILTGAIWGAASIWMFPAGQPSYQAFLAFVIAGMSAGASTSLSYLRLPITAFLTLALTPLAIRFFMEGGTISYAMSAMTILFGIMVYTNSIRIYENTLQNITLKNDAIEKEIALRSSEARYQYLFDSAPLGIIYYDDKGKIINCNQSFCKLLGIDDKTLVGSSFIDMVFSEKLEKTIASSLKNHSTTYKGIASDIAGNKKIDIRVYNSRITDTHGNTVGGMSIIEDISEDRRIEKMKDEFISIVSHELRTPLTSIRGAIKLLQGLMYDELNEKGKELVDISCRNTEQLLALINDILDAERIESGRMDMSIQAVDLPALVRESVSEMSTYNTDKKTHFIIENSMSQCVIMADMKRIRQVMYNLLGNASKFSHQGSDVVIEIRQDNNNVVVSIKNQGDPIPVEFAPMVFNRFTQADSSTTRVRSGSGLGLYITKAIIEHHGGKIGFDSNNGWTAFWFSLPLPNALVVDHG